MWHSLNVKQKTDSKKKKNHLYITCMTKVRRRDQEKGEHFPESEMERL